MSRFFFSMLALLLPSLAVACPVCFDPNETSRGAYINTAAFLTILPLAMIAGSAVWLVFRARELARAERAMAQATPPVGTRA